MVVACIERVEQLAGSRVAEIELVRADRIAFDAEAEQLAFERIEVVGAIDVSSEAFVQ